VSAPARQYTKCQHEGCTDAEPREWSISGYDPEPTFIYCDEHAADAGFCISCGNFYGGTEEFFISGARGLCCECKSEMEEDMYGSPYDEDEYDEP
jgi:hypothetical protein